MHSSIGKTGRNPTKNVKPLLAGNSNPYRMCNGKCVSGVGAADVVDYAAVESQNEAVGLQNEAVESQNEAVQFGNEAVRRAEGQVTFAAKVTLPFAQRSRYRLAKGQATVSVEP